MLCISWEADLQIRHMNLKLKGRHMNRMSSFLIVLLVAGPLAAQTLTTQPSTQPAGESDPMHPRYKMETSLGDIVLELDAERAPITVLNFHRYVDSGFYDGTIFHRVISNLMIQGGGFTVAMEKKTDDLLPPIKNEWQNGLKNVTGTISMARLGGRADSATSQFFINVKDNTTLDSPRDGAGYTVFGRVIEGMETVNKIKDVEVQNVTEKRIGNVPVEPVVINSVKLIGAFDRSGCENQIKVAEEAAKKAEAEARAAQENEMQEFINKTEDETGKKFATTDSGLKYMVLQEGTGDTTPNPTDTVEVHYTGWLLNGTKFESSVDRGKAATVPLNDVIAGWTEGVGLMKVGEKRKLIIPGNLAFGPTGRPPTIPPDATVVFDVELLAIK